MTSTPTVRVSSLLLEHVHFMPEALEPGVLYVSKEFGCAQHLCACGCGNKVMTPVKPFWFEGWDFTEVDGKATLTPSIGSWQLACRSHYFITAGEVVWC
jgi:hypothetical protein